MNNLELKHKANMANVNAQYEQTKNQEKILTSMINSLKNEMHEQRELTKSVAQANNNSAINQSFGKQ